MILETIANLIRWSGAFLAFSVLSVLLYGIWRGAQRPAERTTGRTGTWLRSIGFYLVSSMIFFGVCVAAWSPLPLVLSPAIRAWMLVIGSFLFFPGLLVVLRARLELGKNYFVSTGLGVQLFADQQLVTGGLYARVRHPMYTGIFLAALGSLLIYFTWTTALLACCAPLLTVRARREEAALSAEFGQQWAAYCQHIPAFFPRWKRSGGIDLRKE